MDAYEHGMTLQRYKDYAPTGFDPKGLAGERHGIAEWLVLPVVQTRDSGPLELSNFAAALKALGGEGEHCQVHRFGHWGPGWYELILVDSEHEPSVTIAGELACRLADYPVLDEDDFSTREYEDTLERIEDQAGRWVRDGAPADWAGRVYRKLEDRDLESYLQAGGGSPEDATIKRILRRLRLMEPRWITVRWLGCREVKRPGLPAMYRDIEVWRENPEYPG